MAYVQLRRGVGQLLRACSVYGVEHLTHVVSTGTRRAVSTFDALIVEFGVSHAEFRQAVESEQGRKCEDLQCARRTVPVGSTHGVDELHPFCEFLWRQASQYGVQLAEINHRTAPEGVGGVLPHLVGDETADIVLGHNWWRDAQRADAVLALGSLAGYGCFIGTMLGFRSSRRGPWSVLNTPVEIDLRRESTGDLREVFH